MNPENPLRSEVEARITALLLGELPESEAVLLRWAITQDQELQKLHDRLQLTVGLVREAAKNPESAPVEPVAALKLSAERREKLLAHFKAPRPQPAPVKELFWLKRIEAPIFQMPATRTLVYAACLMVLLLGIAAISIPNFVKARATSQSNAIINNLRQIDAAKNQWALENQKPAEAVATMDDLKPYMKLNNEGRLPAIAGEKYDIGKVSEPVTANLDAKKAKQIGALANRLPAGGARGDMVQLSSEGTVTVVNGADRQRQFVENKAQLGLDLSGGTTFTVTPAHALDGVASPAAAHKRVALMPAAPPPSAEIVLPKSDSTPEEAFASRATVTSASSAALPNATVSGYADVAANYNSVPLADKNRASGVAAQPPAPAKPQAFSTINSTQGKFDAGESFDREVNQHTVDAQSRMARVENQNSYYRLSSGAMDAGVAVGPAGGGGGSTFASRLNNIVSHAASASVGSSSGDTINYQTSDSADASAERRSGEFSSSFKADPNTFYSGLHPAEKKPAGSNAKQSQTQATGKIAANDSWNSGGAVAGVVQNQLDDQGNSYRMIGDKRDANKAPVSGNRSKDQFEDQFAAFSSTANESRSGLESKEKMEPLKTELPPPLMVGTPVPIQGFAYSSGNEAAQKQLEKLTTDADRAKAPVLGDIPVTGELFQNNNRSGAAAEGINHGTHVAGLISSSASLASADVGEFKPASKAELTKAGAGTFALSGNNTYAGGTTVNAGTLGVGGAISGSSTINNGGALAINDSVDSFKVDPNKFYSGLTQDDTSANGGSTFDRSDSSELRNKNIPLKYARPSDIQQALKSLLPDNRSKVVVDAGKRGLDVAGGTDKEIQMAEDVVRKLDVPLQQTLVDDQVINYSLGNAFHFEITNAITTNSTVNEKVLRQANAASIQDRALPKATLSQPIPQPEILCRENNFSTFSLNVSDVSFKLAAASLENGRLPEPASIRSEEFINAFDYRDPNATAGQPVAFASERARYPFAQNRDLLRFSVKTAASGRAADRPLNLVVLLDKSGSMERADRVAIIREAMRVLATQLHPQDTVSVVTFARIARLWADGVTGDKAGETLSQVGRITPEGGTNLEEAMRLAYETARRHYLANGINRVVLLTDGAANLGNVDAAALKQKVEAQRRQGIALDCFGIGWEDFNDDMLAELSGNGDGRYAFINTPEEAGTEFAAKLAGALQVAAQDVKVQVEFNPQRVVSWRQIGYAKHQLTKEQFRDNSVLAAEIAAQEAGNALYTVETKPDGFGPVATVYVRYKIPGTMAVQEHSWEVPYTGNAVALKQSSAAMRLAATASAFSEWLAASPFAQEVSPDELLKNLSGVLEIYGADQRPKKLEWMIRQAKSLSGK